MEYDDINVVEELMGIIDTIVDFAIKITSIVINYGIMGFNVVAQMLGL